jgi:hypothetical protein
MYEVGSGPRSREPDAHVEYLKDDYFKGWDAADVHSGKLTLRCKQGHETVVTLPIPLFELLFDFGCAALLDGYPREAVTSFASSFERFEEFTCRFLLARGNVSFDEVDAWWKEVATSSERQMGSFVALWVSEFFEQPPLLPKKLVKLRNDCVHKGLIPPEDEAKVYGEAVLRAEVGGIVRLRNCFDSQVDYDDFVEDYIIRPDVNEPALESFVGSTVLSSMWRVGAAMDMTGRVWEPHPYDYEPDEDPELEDLRQSQARKNTTDPTGLTMDRALKSFQYSRMFGMRQT